MKGFVQLDCLSGPALVRLYRVMLVRPDPTGAPRTLIVLDGSHEVLVMRPAVEIVRLIAEA
jgi:hypothetical protein